MKKAILNILMGCLCSFLFSQNYTPTIEPCPCMIKLDPRLKSVCGYLVVPENRQKPQGRKVKMPFVFVRKPEQSATQNVILTMTGGPGYSTIANLDSLDYDSGFFNYGSFVFFDQRGTKKSIPCLDCEGVDAAIQRAYRENLAQDSLVGIAVKKCRQKFVTQGIDLSAYTTLESASDIADLRSVLGIKEWTLSGISYSGGLMLTVARNHPEGIKSLMLDSPLPSFVNYEEHALSNHNEAINQIFDNLEADSVQNGLFPNLKQRFQAYFTSISSKKFEIQYQEKGCAKPLKIHYSKNELLDAVIDRLNNNQFNTLPTVIDDLIKGKHEMYIKEVLDSKFSGDKNLSYGMRLSVYCSEQMAYSNKAIVKKQDLIFPWFAGYPFNNINHEICACWQVKPEPAIVKTPVYSNIPALITGGEIDPWCRPFYNRLIKRTMPNSQLLIFKNRAHSTGYGDENTDFLKPFLDNPYKKLISEIKNVGVE
jgi:pimeloyl-ACP methyl ester carboxylesterase